MTTIYDIAKMAGVSITTVSRVINNSGYVSADTKKRVLDAIEKCNYTPNKTAQALSAGSTFKLIGIVCYNIEDMYYAKAVAVLERELRKYGYDILLSCTGESLEVRQNSVDMLISKNVDAIIFIGSVFAGKTEDVILSASKKLPVFLINAYIKHKNIYCAFCDELKAIKHCVIQAYTKGRKNILFMYDVDTYGSQKKLQGYHEGIKECALNLDERYIIKCSPDIEDAMDAFWRSYKSLTIDAVVCSNDVLAAGALSAARKNNIPVPQKLSIIGYNNSLLSRCFYPALTSLENNVEKLSIFTAQNINRYFSGENAIKKHQIDFELVIRDTFR
ncbi:MAG TPA: LacI family transcriptional regulator [Clostridiales bacterium]|nr:LacI family transcriptional regulator [Clostridiales bacterium]